MLELDGRAGGGQQLRTALSLSAVAGRPFRMEHVRGTRPNPGLKPQHVAAVEAVAAATDAETDGVEQGSATVEFEPGAVRGGEVAAGVSTAGSTTLLVDTLSPLAVALEDPLSVTLTGGTDVKWSPPCDYLREVKLPVLRSVGLDADLAVRRRGFYPVGGGRLDLTVRPSSLGRLELTDRGPIDRISVYAVATASLADAEVADRMADAAVEGLGDGEALDVDVAYVEADSPGAVVTLAADCGAARAGFDALGERGVPAEAVAGEAVESFQAWRESDAPVDAWLGDQLMLWVALAGGRVRLPRVTDHVRSNASTIRAFGYDLSVDADGRGGVVAAPPPPE
jgi:RNA 3'-terminal phosphate cyclase (ATP)